MDGPKKPTETKLHTTLNHTGTIIGIVTGVLAIVGFFGFQPRSADSGKAKEGPPASNPGAATSETPKDRKDETSPALRRRGIGTLHLEGGFPLGEPRLAVKDLQPQGRTFTTVETSRPSDSRPETLANTLVLGAVPAGQLAAVWREGTRLLRGVRLSSDHAHVSGNGIDADLPIDPDGRLTANVVWPAKGMFLEISFAGPIEIAGMSFPNGIAFGQDGAPDAGSTLPVRFSLDVPKPGEVLSAFRGVVAYPGTWEGSRTANVLALSPSGGVGATWSAEVKQASDTQVKTGRDGILNEGLSGLKVVFSKSQ